MTRTAAREIAILLGFSATAANGGETAQESMDRFFEPEHYASMAEENPLFSEYPDAQQMDYIRTLVTLVAERRETLDGYIEKYARGWKVGRISRTAGAVLRCAMSEILWLPEVPNAAAINEAVELAKKYEDEDTVSFINGILGGFVRGEVEQKQEEAE